jgi:hypothetical protein
MAFRIACAPTDRIRLDHDLLCQGYLQRSLRKASSLEYHCYRNWPKNQRVPFVRCHFFAGTDVFVLGLSRCSLLLPTLAITERRCYAMTCGAGFKRSVAAFRTLP